LAIGSVALLALGVLVGIVATKYVAGIPVARAATNTTTKVAPPSMVPPAAQNDVTAMPWNPFQDLRDMQLRVDRMFDDMTSQFRMQPSLSLFANSPAYSLSLHVQDLKDHYEVRAYLPDAKASDVKVTLLDKQTLKVEVANDATEAVTRKGANEQVNQWGQYAQIIRLPKPVKSEQMRIDQPTHEVIVTLPKA
jgi:HSP20 family molecular chaperone IbpA